MADVYNRSMIQKISDLDKSFRWTRYVCRFFLLGLIYLLVSADQLRANPDVYAVLPADTRVIQYGLGDPDGDSKEELAVLFVSDGAANLTLFKAESGHWTRWWTDGGLLSGISGASPSSVELVDVNGDGKDDVITYHLTEDGKGMTARIITLDITDHDNPAAGILLEDTTAPPGYPLFGSEDGVPSVTFLKMPLNKGDTGHRRVYCWDGDRFEKCVEVPWVKP
jgi:hypothetical protein